MMLNSIYESSSILNLRCNKQKSFLEVSDRRCDNVEDTTGSQSSN